MGLRSTLNSSMGKKKKRKRLTPIKPQKAPRRCRLARAETQVTGSREPGRHTGTGMGGIVLRGEGLSTPFPPAE